MWVNRQIYLVFAELLKKFGKQKQTVRMKKLKQWLKYDACEPYFLLYCDRLNGCNSDVIVVNKIFVFA